MRVAVVMAVYNGQRHLAAALDSVKRQTLQPIEVVVIDDGSSDGSADIARSFDGVKVVQQANAGVSAARRNGRLALTRDADYVVFFDQDDLMRPNMLERMASHLQHHPEASMAYARFDLLRDDEVVDTAYDFTPRRFIRRGLTVRVVPHDEPRTSVASLMAFVSALPSCSMLRLSAYDQTPGWSSAFVGGGEDTDLFLHMAEVGEVHFLPDTLLYWRSHDTQASGNTERLDAVMQAVLDKWRPRVDRSTLADLDLRSVTQAARLTKHHVRAGRWTEARSSLREAARHAARGARAQLLSNSGK